MNAGFFPILIAFAVAIPIICFLVFEFFESGILSLKTLLGVGICCLIFIAGTLIFMAVRN